MRSGEYEIMGETTDVSIDLTYEEGELFARTIVERMGTEYDGMPGVQTTELYDLYQQIVNTTGMIPTWMGGEDAREITLTVTAKQVCTLGEYLGAEVRKQMRDGEVEDATALFDIWSDIATQAESYFQETHGYSLSESMFRPDPDLGDDLDGLDKEMYRSEAGDDDEEDGMWSGDTCFMANSDISEEAQENSEDQENAEATTSYSKSFEPPMEYNITCDCHDDFDCMNLPDNCETDYVDEYLGGGIVKMRPPMVEGEANVVWYVCCHCGSKWGERVRALAHICP